MSEHELWNELGNLYFMSGTYNQAAYAYRRAIQMDGGFGRPYCNLALTYVKQGRFEEAVQLYQRSIELLVDETERAITWYRLGDVYRHLKDYRDAILAYQAADMLDAELSPNDKETDHILYGGAEVRLVQAGAISPSIPETVPAAEAAASQSQPEPEAPMVEQLSESETAGAEIFSEASDEPVEDMQETPAPVAETVEEGAPAAEIMASTDEEASILDVSATGDEAVIGAPPAEEAGSVIEAVASTAAVEEAPDPVEAAGDPAPIGAAPFTGIEAVAETAVEKARDSEDEAVLDTDPVAEAAGAEVASEPAEEFVEMVVTSEETALETGAAQAVNELSVTEEREAIFEESPVDAAGETSLVPEGAAPDVGLQATEMVPEDPVVPEAETASAAPDAEISPVEEVAALDDGPAGETVQEEAAEIASSATDWEEYVVSSMEQETDVQPLGDPEQALDAWLPEVEMELPGAGTERPAVEPELVEQDPVSDDFPASTEIPSFTLQSPAGAAGALISEDMLTVVPAVTFDFRSEDTQPVFIVPEETEQGFSVVQVESGTTDVACAAESDEPDAEMQGILAEIERFKHAVQSNPRNAPAWDTLGTLYKAARKYRDAIMAYQQAVAVDPSKPHYHHHLGILFAVEGREEDAIKAFQDVIELDPNHSLANATLGGYYRKMGLEELAQKHIGKAMKNFYTSENEYNRACLEALCGNTEQSLELLRIALKNKQTYVDWVLRDPDLDSIRRDPRFKQLISDYASW